MFHNYQPVKGKGMDSADSFAGNFFFTMDIMTIRFVFLAIPMFWEMRSQESWLQVSSGVVSLNKTPSGVLDHQNNKCR
jgi:hypothetical protein